MNILPVCHCRKHQGQRWMFQWHLFPRLSVEYCPCDCRLEETDSWVHLSWLWLLPSDLEIHHRMHGYVPVKQTYILLLCMLTSCFSNKTHKNNFWVIYILFNFQNKLLQRELYAVTKVKFKWNNFCTELLISSFLVLSRLLVALVRKGTKKLKLTTSNDKRLRSMIYRPQKSLT